VPVDRNQAITALTMTELLHEGYLDGQALLAALRDELSCPDRFCKSLE